VDSALVAFALDHLSNPQNRRTTTIELRKSLSEQDFPIYRILRSDLEGAEKNLSVSSRNFVIICLSFISNSSLMPNFLPKAARASKLAKAKLKSATPKVHQHRYPPPGFGKFKLRKEFLAPPVTVSHNLYYISHHVLYISNIQN